MIKYLILACILAILHCDSNFFQPKEQENNLLLRIFETKPRILSKAMAIVDQVNIIKVIVDIKGAEDTHFEWTPDMDNSFSITLPSGQYKMYISHIGTNDSGIYDTLKDSTTFQSIQDQIVSVSIMPGGVTGVELNDIKETDTTLVPVIVDGFFKLLHLETGNIPVLIRDKDTLYIWFSESNADKIVQLFDTTCILAGYFEPNNKSKLVQNGTQFHAVTGKVIKSATTIDVKKPQIVNSSFELGTTGWRIQNVSYNFEIDSTRSFDGKASFKITGETSSIGSGVTMITSSVPQNIQPNKIYILSFYVVASLEEKVTLDVFFVDGKPAINTTISEFSNDWRRYEIIFTTGTNTILPELRFSFNLTPSTNTLNFNQPYKSVNTIWLDNVEINEQNSN